MNNIIALRMSCSFLLDRQIMFCKNQIESFDFVKVLRLKKNKICWFRMVSSFSNIVGKDLIKRKSLIEAQKANSATRYCKLHYLKFSLLSFYKETYINILLLRELIFGCLLSGVIPHSSSIFSKYSAKYGNYYFHEA